MMTPPRLHHKTFLSDLLRIQQVLMNFLSNALKFTLHGRIALRIRECLNGGVEFEVQDSGVGIADRDIPMLF